MPRWNGRIADSLFAHAIKVESGCWEWVRSIDKSGYGSVQLYRDGDIVAAHRAAWILTFGEIPDGMHVLHKCDNRKCINPEHLFLGTNADNVRDKVAKNRQWKPRGEKNHAARLTEDDVRKLRAMYATGKYNTDQLAAAFNVSRAAANKAATGATWSHLQ